MAPNKMLLAFVIGFGAVPVGGCAKKSEPAMPERAFDPRPVAADLVGTWEGPRGKLSFDGETLRATEYWCDSTKPTSPQFRKRDTCTAFDWELPYELDGHRLIVTHHESAAGWRRNIYDVFLDPDERLYVGVGKGFSPLPTRKSVADFGGIAQLRLDKDPCTYVFHSGEWEADCVFEEKDGRTWLRFNETIVDEKRPVELVYLEELGLLVLPDHLEAVFTRVTDQPPSPVEPAE